MPEIYQYLKDHQIEYQKFDHPPLFSADDAHLAPEMPGAAIKNLFLRDKKGTRHILVVVGLHKQVDLKSLKDLVGASSGLGFASPERLKTYLGVEPGSVTILALINDPNHNVEIFFDEEIWGSALQCHPLINTATLVIPPHAIEQFLKSTNHNYKIIKVPGR